MAGYNIVLNLGGNAVSNSERLATNLAAAAANATTLASALRSVGAAYRSIPNRRFTVPSAPRQSRPYARPLRTASRPATAHPYAQGAPYTRHRSTRIASWGYGFSLGGFNARLSSVLQPDENGMLFGMDAGRLMRGVNVAGIAGNIMTSIGRALFKATKMATFSGPMIAGGVMTAALRVLQSDWFAEGAKLISRRHQTREGMGPQYEQTLRNADIISAAYGLDRSTTLSSINVLAGLGVGANNRKITLGEATGLTKVGGLIAQHAGVSFERVMTNIQQLLVTTAPNMRDIRELLNQAPILGKYALKEMEEQGLKGVDVRTYLKDQGALLSVLKRYELSNASNAGMRARGMINMASQDAAALIASNNPFWSYIGNAGSGMIKALATSANKFMSMLVDNRSFLNMVKSLEMTIDMMGDKGVTLVDKLITLVDRIAAYFKIELVDEQAVKAAVDREQALRAAMNDPSTRNKAYQSWLKQGVYTSKTEAGRREEFSRVYEQVAEQAARDEKMLSLVQAKNDLRGIESVPWRDRLMRGFLGTIWEVSAKNKANIYRSQREALHAPDSVFTYLAYPDTLPNNMTTTQAASSMLTVERNVLLKEMNSRIERLNSVEGLDPSKFNLGSAAGGKDLTGFNRDRQALEIHFHDKLVEWNSTIKTDDPQQVVNEVADTMDQLVAAAIQQALLGSTDKMATRF
nr:MAG TPA: hypothetical protein [Caudoviricetes sp.]